jgi:hypothetical protein
MAERGDAECASEPRAEGAGGGGSEPTGAAAAEGGAPATQPAAGGGGGIGAWVHSVAAALASAAPALVRVIGAAVDAALPAFLGVPRPEPVAAVPPTVTFKDRPGETFGVSPAAAAAAVSTLEAFESFTCGLGARLVDVDRATAERRTALAQAAASVAGDDMWFVGGTDTLWLQVRGDSPLLGAFVGGKFDIDMKVTSFPGEFHRRSATVRRCARGARTVLLHARAGGGVLSDLSLRAFYVHRPAAFGEPGDCFFGWRPDVLDAWDPASELAPPFDVACGALLSDAREVPPPPPSPALAGRWALLQPEADGMVPLSQFARVMWDELAGMTTADWQLRKRASLVGERLRQRGVAAERRQRGLGGPGGRPYAVARVADLRAAFPEFA